MLSAVRNDVRASAGRATSLDSPTRTAARNASASTQQRPPSVRTYPPGPVWISVRSPSARRMRLTRTSTFPAGSAGGSSGHSTLGDQVLRDQAPAPQRQQPQQPPGQPAAERAQCDLLAVTVHREPAEQPDPDHRQHRLAAACPGRTMDEPRGAETLAGGDLVADGCRPVMTVTAGSAARQAARERPEAAATSHCTASLVPPGWWPGCAWVRSGSGKAALRRRAARAASRHGGTAAGSHQQR